MLRDLDRDGEATDYAVFADRAPYGLAWRNRERVIDALRRKRLINDYLQLTDAGREALS
jgi:hypothetical protein